MSKAGYDTHFKVYRADDFGLPQARNRCYILGLRKGLNTAPPERIAATHKTLFAAVDALMQKMMLSAPGLEEVLLPDDDPILQKELARCLEHEPPQTMSEPERTSLKNEWADKLGERFKAGCKDVEAADQASAWYPSLCLRKKSALEYHQKKIAKQLIAHATRFDAASTATRLGLERVSRLRQARTIAELTPNNMITAEMSTHQDQQS